MVLLLLMGLLLGQSLYAAPMPTVEPTQQSTVREESKTQSDEQVCVSDNKPESVEEDAIGIIKIFDKVEATDELIEKIIAFAENPFIKGVLLIIDSGGGAIGSSELIYREMKELALQKPIVTLVINSCCSGAYWIALASDWIVAQASSDIGSIGVKYIVQKYKNYTHQDESHTAELDISVTCAGKFKGFSDPRTAPMNEEEKASVREYVDNLYDIFTECVEKERGTRGLTLATRSKWADGREFTGKQALALGLVDELGCRSDAVKRLKELIRDRHGIPVTQKLIFVA